MWKIILKVAKLSSWKAKQCKIDENRMFCWNVGSKSPNEKQYRNHRRLTAKMYRCKNCDKLLAIPSNVQHSLKGDAVCLRLINGLMIFHFSSFSFAHKSKLVLMNEIQWHSHLLLPVQSWMIYGVLWTSTYEVFAFAVLIFISLITTLIQLKRTKL